MRQIASECSIKSPSWSVPSESLKQNIWRCKKRFPDEMVKHRGCGRYQASSARWWRGLVTLSILLTGQQVGVARAPGGPRDCKGWGSLCGSGLGLASLPVSPNIHAVCSSCPRIKNHRDIHIMLHHWPEYPHLPGYPLFCGIFIAQEQCRLWLPAVPPPPPHPRANFEGTGS